MNILTVNLVFSTLVLWAAARLYVLPNLARWTPQAVLLPILLLHSFRHLGLMFLAPGARNMRPRWRNECRSRMGMRIACWFHRERFGTT